ncbi:failed axon connections homolog isoform X2 [Ostrea edulis]|uniref:failed axon connections homolog isoform X2 n=1 Tax=Ostrea edulis TaxID=37623 RepID=UPI00209513B6|nr:failed axon connections homolog isoform X2 [Ostrea edulis]
MGAITNFVICITASMGVVLITVIRRGRKRVKKVYPSNTIVHHQVGRGPYAPSITPFTLKLETYFRMAKLPYLNVHDSGSNKGSKGKLTWIEVNGEKIADSEFCIQYVNRKFNVSLDEGFSEEDRAAALAIQRMVDEHLYWTLALQRYVYSSKDGINISKMFNFPWVITLMLRNLINKQTYAQGVGRHTEEEVHHVMHEDLTALSKFLGCVKLTVPCLECWLSYTGTVLEDMEKHPLKNILIYVASVNA